MSAFVLICNAYTNTFITFLWLLLSRYHCAYHQNSLKFYAFYWLHCNMFLSYLIFLFLHFFLCISNTLVMHLYHHQIQVIQHTYTTILNYKIHHAIISSNCWYIWVRPLHLVSLNCVSIFYSTNLSIWVCPNSHIFIVPYTIKMLDSK